MVISHHFFNGDLLLSDRTLTLCLTTRQLNLRNGHFASFFHSGRPRNALDHREFYEYEPGLHYIGGLEEGSLGRTARDQITGGQVESAPLEEAFDKCAISSGEDLRFYEVLKGRKGKQGGLLKKQGVAIEFDICP